MSQQLSDAAINGLFGLGSAGLSFGSNVLGNVTAYHYANKLADQNMQRSIKMWNMQNEYNHPKAQMERAKEAGINPYSIAGAAGGSSAPAASFAPASMHANTDFSGIDVFSKFQNSATWLESLRKLIADRKKAKAEKDLIDSQRDNINVETATKNYILTHNLPFTTKKLSNEVQNLAKRNILLSLQAQGQGIQNQISKYNLDNILPLEQRRLDLQNQQGWYNLKYMSPAQRLNFLANTANLKANTEFIKGAKTTMTKAQANNLNWMSINAILEGANLISKGEILEQDLKYKKKQYDFYHNYGSDKPGNLMIGGIIPYGRLEIQHPKAFYNLIHRRN